MATTAKQTKAPAGKSADFTYIIIYFLEWLTGIIFFIISGDDKRKKLHSIQAILLGIGGFIVIFIVGIILAIIGLGIISSLLWLLLWLYGLYIGYMASTGVDVEIPMITSFAKQYA